MIGSDHIDGPTGDWGSHVMISDDDGTTWRLGQNLPEGNECQVAQLNNNSLIVNMRSKDSKRHFSWSYDDGDHWTEPTTAPFDEYHLGGDCEGSTVVLPDSGIVVFSTPYSAAGRDNMTIFTYVPNCESKLEISFCLIDGMYGNALVVELNADRRRMEHLGSRDN